MRDICHGLCEISGPGVCEISDHGLCEISAMVCVRYWTWSV